MASEINVSGCDFGRFNDRQIPLFGFRDRWAWGSFPEKYSSSRFDAIAPSCPEFGGDTAHPKSASCFCPATIQPTLET